MRLTLLWAILFAFPCTWAFGQTLTQRPGQRIPASRGATASQPTPNLIPLTVPTGTALKVALDQEVRIQRVGQAVHGKIVEPVYAFDQLVVPVGTGVIGKISAIDRVPEKRRIVAAMNGEFSPSRQVHIDFTELVLADGGHVPLQADVWPGSRGVLQFVSASQPEKQKSEKDGLRSVASRKIGEAKKELKRERDRVKTQLDEPEKMHRLERFVVAQLPYHPQYVDPGTSFNADLRSPLDFGIKPLMPPVLDNIGSPLPAGSVVHAMLITPLGSAHSKKGDAVEAVVTQPLVASGHLFLPEGSRLKGSVLQVRPARKFSRNGQLRDSEGGAQVTTPKTRYLTTAISVALASSSMADHDRDAGMHGADGGDLGKGAANGASGFHFLGTIVGALAHSRVVTSGFGFYGASMSVYSHFLARGRDVVYPRDMSMIIGVGTNGKQPVAGATPTMPME